MMGQILAAQSGRRIAIDRQIDKIRLGLPLVSYAEGATASARGGERQVFIRRDKFGPQFARLYFQALHLAARPLGNSSQLKGTTTTSSLSAFSEEIGHRRQSDKW